MPGTVQLLSMDYISMNFQNSSQQKHTHFTDAETEAQRG